MHANVSSRPACTILLWNRPWLPARLAAEEGITLHNGLFDTTVSQRGERTMIQGDRALARIKCSHLYHIKVFHLGNLFYCFFFFFPFEEDESLNQALLGARHRINGAV